MSRKLRIGVLCGGRSAEHEVSLQSAKNVVSALDKSKYEVILIGLDKQGRWILPNSTQFLLNEDNPKLISLNSSGDTVAIRTGVEDPFLIESRQEGLGQLDVVFPVLHGPYGEDGTVQGLLKLANIPFVGASVLGSAVGMDKDVMKRLLRDAQIPIGRFQTFDLSSKGTIAFESLVESLGSPLFIKPANLGSSVGVSRVETKEELERAVTEAFSFDTKILIEECIYGREIECSVLGNEEPIASLPGEIIPHHTFYSYDAKYIDADGAGLKIPAELPEEIVAIVQKRAVETYKVLCCEGMARVDFFFTQDGKVLVNEINTLPGFTRISMYPKMWEASGLSYSDLLDRLIQLALQRHARDSKLRTS